LTERRPLTIFAAVSLAFLIQTAASAVAIALMVALAAWARAGRPAPPLDAEAAKALFADEFPGRALEGLWVTSDRAGAIARAGDRALVLIRLGDGYAARDMAWSEVSRTKLVHGKLRLRLRDPGAPELRLKVGAWPPRETAA
jgi:hypothetical protein